MIRIVLPGEPISQCRHRHGKGRTYDPRAGIKKNLKWIIVSQLRQFMHKMPANEPLHMILNLNTKIAESLSTVKKTALHGRHDISAPDVDNYAKFYMDTLNEIAYDDDRTISRLWVEKRKSNTPSTEIVIYSIGAEMINEHAKTVDKEITAADLEYMVKKANKIGRQGREIIRTYIQEDSEGRHVYFECEAMKERCHD